MMKLLLLMLMISLTACNNRLQQKPFDRTKWDDCDAGICPERDAMLNDLLQHHLKGLTFKQLTNTIGEPLWDSIDGGWYYDIAVDYGSDIDPVYTKSLLIYMNKDSVITGYKVHEWHQGDK